LTNANYDVVKIRKMFSKFCTVQGN